MSTMNLPPVLRQRYFDSNGLPLAGGKLFSYQAGTSTLQNTYTDQSGVTPNANPLVLDSQGYGTMWVDPTLSYKFVLEDTSGNVQWTIDNVVGLLTANAVTTASILDGAVTSAKLAAGAVNSAALESDASVDANRPVNTNNIRDGAITTGKIAAGAVTYPKISGLLAPTVQVFTTGSGTYNKTYLFAVSAANATVGATYTDSNSHTFTVSNTLSSGNILQMTGPSAPAASGTLTRVTGTGDATIAYTSFAAPLYLKAKMVGAGGGGGGGNGTGTGGAGAATTFGTSLLTANGGNPGGPANNGFPTGGTVTINSPAVSIVALQGADGGAAGATAGGQNLNGAMGGSSPFGGAGASGPGASGTPGNAGAGIANSGSGGGGGGSGSGNFGGGGGGAAGGYIEAMIPSPSTTYSFSIGAGGSGGNNGAAGGSGIVIIEEHYQ